MENNQNASTSRDRLQVRGSKDLDPTQRELIDAHTIAVRGSLDPEMIEGDPSVVQEVANRLIDSYPTFLRGVYSAVLERDFGGGAAETSQRGVFNRGSRLERRRTA